MRRWLSRLLRRRADLAYRGLFNWIRPAIYIPTMLGAPLFQLIFFTKLGQFAHAESRDFYIVGNSVQVVRDVVGVRHDDGGRERALVRDARAAARVACEPRGGVPRPRPARCSRTASSSRSFTFVAGACFLGFRPGLDSVPALAAIVVVTTSRSCTSFGMLLGSIGLRAKDFFFAANLAYFLMLLFCGVNIPLDVLPGWMSAIGRCLPLTHGIAAAREVASGRDARPTSRGSSGPSSGSRPPTPRPGSCSSAILERESRRSAVLDAY